MMADDGYSPHTKCASDVRLISTLQRENDAMRAQLHEYKEKPLRRMLTKLWSSIVDWIMPILVLFFVLIMCFAAMHGASVRRERLEESCAFQARINATKAEFDNNNEICYIYNSTTKKFEKHED